MQRSILQWKVLLSGGQMLFFFTDTLCPGIPIGTENDMGCTESSLFGGRLELYSSRGKWGHKTIKGLLALLAKSFGSLVSVWVVVLSFSTSLKWSIVR